MKTSPHLWNVRISAPDPASLKEICETTESNGFSVTHITGIGDGSVLVFAKKPNPDHKMPASNPPGACL